MLLATVADALNWLVWSKTKDGQKNTRAPKQIPRPGIDDGATSKKTRGIALPLDQMKKKLNMLRAKVLDPNE